MWIVHDGNRTIWKRARLCASTRSKKERQRERETERRYRCNNNKQTNMWPLPEGSRSTKKGQ